MSETKRELILEAAMVLFEQRGFDGTTVPMIVDKAGVEEACWDAMNT